MLLVWGEGLLLVGLSLVSLPLLAAAGLIYASAYAALGLCISLVSSTSHRANTGAASAVGIICFLHWLLWLVYVPFLLVIDEPLKTAGWLLRLHAGLTPPLVLPYLTNCMTPLLGMAGLQFDGFTPFVLFGLCVWAVAGCALWRWTIARFDVHYFRTGRIEPEVALDPGQDQGAIRDQLTDSRHARRWRRRLALAMLALCFVAAIPFGLYYRVGVAAKRDLRDAVASLDRSDRAGT